MNPFVPFVKSLIVVHCISEHAHRIYHFIFHQRLVLDDFRETLDSFCSLNHLQIHVQVRPEGEKQAPPTGLQLVNVQRNIKPAGQRVILSPIRMATQPQVIRASVCDELTLILSLQCYMKLRYIYCLYFLSQTEHGSDDELFRCSGRPLREPTRVIDTF